MLTGRPLYDTSADARVFVVPEEWNTLMRAVERRNNVLVSAPRGWGKTTFLRQIQRTLRDGGEETAFVDATSVDSATEVVVRARNALTGTTSTPERWREQAELVGTVWRGDPSPPPAGVSYALMNDFQALGALPESTVLVDASNSAAAVYATFGRLRDVIWQLPQRWVVAVNDDEEAAALKPPADAFFDIVLRPSPWSIDRLMSMLNRRIEDGELGDQAVQDIAAGSDGNPRTALRAANEALVTGRPPAAALSDRAEILERAAQLGRPYGVLMAELLDLGQASPSDAALLDRLGLSRARVTALLRELLDHDLVVTSSDSSSAGAGRPRTLYRPKLRHSR
jgi:hypothetical protein